MKQLAQSGVDFDQLTKDKADKQGLLKIRDLYAALNQEGVTCQVEQVRQLQSFLRESSDVEIMGADDAIDSHQLINAIYDTTYEQKPKEARY